MAGVPSTFCGYSSRPTKSSDLDLFCRSGSLRVPERPPRVMKWAGLILAALLPLGCRERPAAPPRASLSVASVLHAADDRGYARALAPRELHFPADQGAHPEFRTEWW